MSSIFDEIAEKYAQAVPENLAPGSTVTGNDGKTYKVVEDPNSGAKSLVTTDQPLTHEQPEDQSQAAQPMGANTIAQVGEDELTGLSEQDWKDIASMGDDIKQFAEQQNMKGILEVAEDLTDFVLSFVNIPEDMET